MSTSANLGSKLNRKCKTCFNSFLSVFICIDLAHVNNMSSIIVNDKERNFRFSFEPRFAEVDSLSFSLRPSVLRHVMYTIVDRYDNERETWSKSNAHVVPCVPHLETLTLLKIQNLLPGRRKAKIIKYFLPNSLNI